MLSILSTSLFIHSHTLSACVCTQAENKAIAAAKGTDSHLSQVNTEDQVCYYASQFKKPLSLQLVLVAARGKRSRGEWPPHWFTLTIKGKIQAREGRTTSSGGHAENQPQTVEKSFCVRVGIVFS